MPVNEPNNTDQTGGATGEENNHVDPNEANKENNHVPEATTPSETPSADTPGPNENTAATPGQESVDLTTSKQAAGACSTSGIHQSPSKNKILLDLLVKSTGGPAMPPPPLHPSSGNDGVGALAAVEAPPTVEIPAFVEAPPTVEIPAFVEASPTVEIPAFVEAPPTVEIPAVVETPPTVEALSVADALPTVEALSVTDAPTIVESPPVVEAPPAVVPPQDPVNASKRRPTSSNRSPLARTQSGDKRANDDSGLPEPKARRNSKPDDDNIGGGNSDSTRK